MFYIIQENVFNEVHYDLLIETTKRFGIEFEIVKYLPFSKSIKYKTKRKDVWCWGSLNLAICAKKYNWVPGSMYNTNHDYEVYSKHYKDNLLNYEGTVINFGDPLPGNDLYFIRPTQDTKSFTAKVYGTQDWIDYINLTKESKTYKRLVTETRVLVAPLKQIYQEIRVWIIKGKVITASRYRIGGRVIYENYDHETEIVEFAQRMADIYCPADAFVMDVAIVEEGLKIVEINCINHAGFYHSNLQKLMLAIEENF